MLGLGLDLPRPMTRTSRLSAPVCTVQAIDAGSLLVLVLGLGQDLALVMDPPIVFTPGHV